MKQKRRIYSREFKQEAVRLTRQTGTSVAGVARDLGLDANTLSKWRGEEEQRGDQSFPGKGRSHDAELAQLRRENALLRQERDILPSAIGYCASVPR